MANTTKSSLFLLVIVFVKSKFWAQVNSEPNCTRLMPGKYTYDETEPQGCVSIIQCIVNRTLLNVTWQAPKSSHRLSYEIQFLQKGGLITKDSNKTDHKSGQLIYSKVISLRSFTRVTITVDIGANFNSSNGTIRTNTSKECTRIDYDDQQQEVTTSYRFSSDAESTGFSDITPSPLDLGLTSPYFTLTTKRSSVDSTPITTPGSYGNQSGTDNTMDTDRNHQPVTPRGRSQKPGTYRNQSGIESNKTTTTGIGRPNPPGSAQEKPGSYSNQSDIGNTTNIIRTDQLDPRPGGDERKPGPYSNQPGIGGAIITTDRTDITESLESGDNEGRPEFKTPQCGGLDYTVLSVGLAAGVIVLWVLTLITVKVIRHRDKDEVNLESSPRDIRYACHADTVHLSDSYYNLTRAGVTTFKLAARDNNAQTMSAAVGPKEVTGKSQTSGSIASGKKNARTKVFTMLAAQGNNSLATPSKATEPRELAANSETSSRDASLKQNEGTEFAHGFTEHKDNIKRTVSNRTGPREVSRKSSGSDASRKQNVRTTALPKLTARNNNSATTLSNSTETREVNSEPSIDNSGNPNVNTKVVPQRKQRQSPSKVRDVSSTGVVNVSDNHKLFVPKVTARVDVERQQKTSISVAQPDDGDSNIVPDKNLDSSVHENSDAKSLLCMGPLGDIYSYVIKPKVSDSHANETV